MYDRFIQKYSKKNIAIWGLGKEGLSAFAFFRKHLPHKHIILTAASKPDQLILDDYSHFIAEDQFFANDIDTIDVIVKSPGISLYCDNAVLAKEKHVQITSVTNIFYALPLTTKTIAITGTNGKSTVSSLLFHILKTLGHSGELGGNIGTALLDLSGTSEFTITELSSYQTADFRGTIDLAILLNLFPEHIQWHGNHPQYFTDKVNLLRHAKDYILNKTDPRSAHIKLPKSKYFNDLNGIHITENAIYQKTQLLLKAADCKIIGHHNLENISAALKACEYFGISLSLAAEAAKSFKGLDHRLEFLGKTDDHYYVNDSISTTPESAIAALKALADYKTTIILGGEERQQDYSSLVDYMSHNDNIIAITAYETGPRLHEALQKSAPNVPLFKAADLTEAQIIANSQTPKDGLILLSPAAPSYDAFKNFEERGNLFKSNILP
jgi:UDP-N-acetylmuramoylalanine--D-glutamate ligase